MYKNIDEFISLISKYESITYEDLLTAYNTRGFGFVVLSRITGFGSTYSCTLCAPCGYPTNCALCLWSYDMDEVKNACSKRDPELFNKIYHADNADDLFVAIQNRVKVMKELLEKYMEQV